MKIHREGTNILLILFAMLAMLNLAAWLVLRPVEIPIALSVISAVTYGFVFNFFRCPRRHYQGARQDMVISSVDGRVVVIEHTYEDEYIKGKAIQVSVFMSPSTCTPTGSLPTGRWNTYATTKGASCRHTCPKPAHRTKEAP